MGMALIARRAFDITVSFIALLFLAVPFLIVAVVVKLSSKGPAIYVQESIGQGGRLFGYYKFRSMRAVSTGPKVTARGDPRITPVGRFLRRTKIDELPQLFNVLRGEMSIIGPRPEAEKFVRHYNDEQRKILEVRPGLAGMAQLVYPREAELLQGRPDPERAYIEEWMPRKVKVDLEYERRRTLASDLGLIWEIGLLILGFRRHEDPEIVRAMQRDGAKR